MVGVLAVPGGVAQQVADDLVAAGVKIIFNYSDALLSVPSDVTVHTSSPAVELLYRSGDDWRLIAENVQEQWRRELGIDVDVVVHDQAAFFRRIAEEAPPAMHLARWIADFPDPENFMSLFTSGSGNNHLGFDSPRYDELVDEAVRVQDAPARLAMYDEAQRILLLDQVAIAPIYVNALNWMIAPRVEGLEVNPMGVLYLRDVRVGELP